MAARKTRAAANGIVKNETATIDGRLKLTAGREATVLLPGRTNRVRAKFLYADDHGNLVFVDPRNGGLRTVRPDAVRTVHTKPKLRSNP